MATWLANSVGKIADRRRTRNIKNSSSMITVAATATTPGPDGSIVRSRLGTTTESESQSLFVFSGNSERHSKLGSDDDSNDDLWFGGATESHKRLDTLAKTFFHMLHEPRSQGSTMPAKTGNASTHLGSLNSVSVNTTTVSDIRNSMDYPATALPSLTNQNSFTNVVSSSVNSRVNQLANIAIGAMNNFLPTDLHLALPSTSNAMIRSWFAGDEGLECTNELSYVQNNNNGGSTSGSEFERLCTTSLVADIMGIGIEELPAFLLYQHFLASIYRALLQERDEEMYLNTVNNLRAKRAAGLKGHALLVVGGAHLPGIVEKLKTRGI